ncbi:MAG: lysophospholipid acyltransferase family protein [Pseudomonadota bacterium]
MDGDIQTNQQTVYVGNHMSYLDIPLLGSILKANFVSKDDVRQWPIFGTLAYLAKTIFISRAPSKALQSLKQINDALDQKENLIVFPEGTSTSGTDILPFKSSFFDLFLKHKMKDEILIQPFTVTMQTADKEQERSSEKLDQYAWYGDMDLQPHLWSLAMSKGVDMKVQFHPAIAVKDYDNRKKIAADCFSLTKSGHQSEKEAA